MFLGKIKEKTDKIFAKSALGLYRLGLTPNLATLISFIFTLAAIYYFFNGKLLLGGVMLVFDYLFDFFDGVIAMMFLY